MFASFESLESRRLLSVSLEDGVLTVTGTEDADQLGLGRNQTQIVVNDNGTTSTWNPTEVTSIVVLGLGGNDQIAVRAAMGRPVTLDGGEGNEAIHGGAGRERILGGAGNDRLAGGGGGDILEGGDDNDFISGGAGQDRMLGGSGDDHFDAVDTFADLLDGGDGEDYARISRGDRAINIEHIIVRPPSNNTDASREVGDFKLIDEVLA
jgi:Ca2+-binding RTX toxin-like protein